jgi:hypothetical protein
MSDGGYIEGGPVPLLPRLRDEYLISFEETWRASRRAIEAQNRWLQAIEERGTGSASVSDAPDAS